MYVTDIHLRVLSEQPLPDEDIAAIVREATDGAYVMSVPSGVNSVAVKDEHMKQLLHEAGSTPDFFFPDED